MKVIEINNLTKYYGKSRGVVDISFDVEEGEIFGFIGPNGAGKSTTIRTMLGLIYPTKGEVKLFGKDCIKDGHEIRSQIGYLPSEVFYYDNMRAIDLLNYSASFYKKDCSKRISELAKFMDLDLKKKIDDMSFGNRKKVGIVQGLLHDPKLIILDEPTSGLDPLMQQQFFKLLEEENKKGVTVLLSSHILNEVQRLCKRVAIIKDGSIVKLEKISTLQESNYKKVKVETPTPLDVAYFNIEGATNIQRNANITSFMFKGGQVQINTLMKKISEIEIINVWLDEPDLEEIFMHYYEKEA